MSRVWIGGAKLKTSSAKKKSGEAFDPLERSKWLKNVDRTTSSGPSNEVTKH